jgi:GTP-binding protein
VVADRIGSATAYAITGIQERASMFIGPTEEVYAGMIVGENPRSEDMDVNICREKKLTNVRASASDDTIRLTPPRRLSLEQALEYIADDECVEVMPGVVRLRKVELDATARARTVKRLKNARA